MKANRVLLAAMPWADDSVPSLQVGALQSFLCANGIDADGAHWFVDIAHAIGVETYRHLWVPRLIDGEALYSVLLFPEKRAAWQRDARLNAKVRDRARPRGDGRVRIPLELTDRFVRRFEQLHQEILDRYDWSRYALVGLTLNYGQTAASLYMAREIRKRNPACRVIVGGAEAAGDLGASLLKHFPQVDYACNGEGELPLLQLAQAIVSGATDEEIAAIPGIVSRSAAGDVRINAPAQLQRLDVLPIPDFEPYFAALDAIGPGLRRQMCARLPIEASRGCYYSCSFCSVALQWDGVRAQSPENVAAAMRAYADRHQILEFEFADNVNPANAEAIFDRVAADGRDYRFFFELRTAVGRRALASMRRAGLTVTQMGIEALSPSLLAAFNKRTSVIANLQGLKNCVALGIRVTGNLIVNHPRATLADVNATLQTMRIARAYPPPDDVSYFALEYGAPDYATEAGGAIEILGNHPEYRRVYPHRLLRTLNLTRKRFRRRNGRAVSWRRVIAAREDWERAYRDTTRQLGPGVPHLAYYDGGDFLRVEDYRSGALEVYTLRGVERDVYLAADQVTSWRTLRSRVPHVDEAALRREVSELVDAGLMFEEDDKVLSLAVRGRARGAQPEAVRDLAEPAASVRAVTQPR
jgi:ribosomal peptide maturation radical SAM protein 1